MNTNLKRRKDPAAVRSKLLEAAALVVVGVGLPALSLDEVAKRAGVSKGGLLHHFPGRQDLVAALFRQVLSSLDQKICLNMEQDANPAGRFTRAYVLAVSEMPEHGEALECFASRLLGAASLAMAADRQLDSIWRDWLESWLEKCGEADRSELARIIRYAADGLWLEDCASPGKTTGEERGRIIKRLLEMAENI